MRIILNIYLLCLDISDVQVVGVVQLHPENVVMEESGVW